MSSRILAAAFALILSASALHAQRAWKPLDEALHEAQAGRRLVLLDLHGWVPVDRKNDLWIEEAERNPAVAGAMAELVLASATRSSNLDSLPDLAKSRGGKRHLLLLDPWGGIIMEPEGGFGDLEKLAYALNALRQQTPTFIRAGTVRQEGKVAHSLVLRGGGLLDAGAMGAAGSAFRQASSMAEKENDVDALQNAQLGIAAIDLQSQHPNTLSEATKILEGIAAHPATTDIASRVWMMLAYYHRQRGEVPQAVAAYQKAFAAAPRPSALAEAARRHLETLGSEPESELLADVASGNVRLLYPHHEVMVGNIDFGVVTSNDTARVEVFLDDARVAELSRPPFSTKVSLGVTPHVRTVRAVAFDAQERRLGESSVTVNDRILALGVNIVAPRGDSVTSRTVVEVQPRIPEGNRLAGVDLYWNQTKVATLTAAPFRYELVLPSPSASGYIRAVVRGDDGATAEDVKMINAGGVSDQVRVDAVQVYAIVEDRRGHYIDGLKASDFVVKEEGQPVTARVHSGSGDPISIGLALDASGSMQVAMTEVIDYANEFVLHALGAADRTFVTAFDEEPRMVQPLTSNRKHLTEAIYDMQAGGGSAIWDAVLFSLQQFHEVPGKRALVVFTDGINNAGSATAQSALQYAREVGVPVYVVQIFTGGINRNLLFNGPHETLGGRSDQTNENILNNLTESTGGAFFRFVGKKDLPRIFSQIRDDTRGQYLLTYVSPETKPGSELRRISVEVPGKPVVVRATSGYYPR